MSVPTITKADSTSASAFSTGTGLTTERDVYYGTPKINNSKNYNSNTTIYAPTSGGDGSIGMFLKSNGSTSTPTWGRAVEMDMGQSYDYEEDYWYDYARAVFPFNDRIKYFFYFDSDTPSLNRFENGVYQSQREFVMKHTLSGYQININKLRFYKSYSGSSAITESLIQTTCNGGTATETWSYNIILEIKLMSPYYRPIYYAEYLLTRRPYNTTTYPALVNTLHSIQTDPYSTYISSVSLNIVNDYLNLNINRKTSANIDVNLIIYSIPNYKI